VIKSFQNREVSGTSLGAYRNLGTNDPARQWSAKALSGPDKGKKVGEGDSFTLTGVTGFVRASTLARLNAAKANPGEGKGEKGHREVFAWLIGTLGEPQFPTETSRRITFDPFGLGRFVYADTGEDFTGADAVVFHTDGKVYQL
jgi:hypothetical protein